MDILTSTLQGSYFVSDIPINSRLFKHFSILALKKINNMEKFLQGPTI